MSRYMSRVISTSLINCCNFLLIYTQHGLCPMVLANARTTLTSISMNAQAAGLATPLISSDDDPLALRQFASSLLFQLAIPIPPLRILLLNK
jgi:hypothetical protein